MKKKVNLFGKGIPVFLIVLLGFGLVSAALVPYLSGMITANVEAKSPMEIKISETEGDWTGSTGWDDDNALDFGVMHGGGVITFYTRETNLALDKPITGNVVNIVTSDPVDEIEISCDDFESVIVQTKTEESADFEPESGIDLTEGLLCDDSELNIVKFIHPSNPITWSVADPVDVNKIVVTFKINTVGTYTFTSEVLAL